MVVYKVSLTALQSEGRLYYQPLSLWCFQTRSLDAHRHCDDALMAPPAFLLDHLPFGAPILEDDLRVATRPRVSVVKTHVVACVLVRLQFVKAPIHV
jgi:hypothetical protein